MTKANRLIHEKSPYLLQHAHQPVDWHPWGDEAFLLARQEDRPVFLSIGYSTCHWCHVMAHESFDDSQVAALLNDAFVCIKVDREERPDIDKIYMAVCQMLTGGGGWPLTLFMTPDRQPFFAGTYIPKKDRFGRMGLIHLIPRIQEAWQSQRQGLLHSAGQILAALQKSDGPSFQEAISLEVVREACNELYASFDEAEGGFGAAPKFPVPHHLTLLLRHWKRTGDAKALEMVEKTLTAMRCGGIFDQLGYGFHRYSTDRHWLVPHFEKMLYDQALLVMAYADAYQATGRDLYERTIREILRYVLRVLTSPEGGFYCAEDADSEGQEGRFYLWTEAEIVSLLMPGEADCFLNVFQIRKEGNFTDEIKGARTGLNIPHLKGMDAVGRSAPSGQNEECQVMLARAREKLFQAREKRVHPHKDDKILTDWNGLMIAAFARAAQIFDDGDYLETAVNAADFILGKMMHSKDGRLLHRYRDGQAAISANLDDYAFLIWGLIDLYEASFNVAYLEKALTLQNVMDRSFWDGDRGGYFFTPSDGEVLLMRQKDVYDGAIPSGNAVALMNLIRLAGITGRSDLNDRAVSLTRAFASEIRRHPSAHSQFMAACDSLMGDAFEIVVCGDPDAADTGEMLHRLRRAFLPNKVLLFRPADEPDPAISRLAEFTRAMVAVDGRATAYVCSGHTCRPPTHDIDEVLKPK